MAEADGGQDEVQPTRRKDGICHNARLGLNRARMSISTHPESPSLSPTIIAASDFTSNATAIAARLGFSFTLPAEGVPVRTTQAQSTSSMLTYYYFTSTDSASSATAMTSRSGRSIQVPSEGRRHSRPRLDVKGRRFYMRGDDVKELWPQWHHSKCHRVLWTVLNYVGTIDRLRCRYAGKSRVNRALIGNNGVTEFALKPYAQFCAVQTRLAATRTPAPPSQASSGAKKRAKFQVFVSASRARIALCTKPSCGGAALTMSKKQARCRGGKINDCGYHAQFKCTVCRAGAESFKFCVC